MGYALDDADTLNVPDPPAMRLPGFVELSATWRRSR